MLALTVVTRRLFRNREPDRRFVRSIARAVESNETGEEKKEEPAVVRSFGRSVSVRRGDDADT